MSDPNAKQDVVAQAVERSRLASLILDRHKGALFPHLAILHQTFGSELLRNIVSGAVEATILAARKGAVIVPFPEDET